MKQMVHTMVRAWLAVPVLAVASFAFAQTEEAVTGVERGVQKGEQALESVAREGGEAVDETLSAEVQAVPVAGQILLQSENTILAEDLIGLTVYSSDNEEVGEINDLIVNLDGSVEGALIGVGGFLGIGEKEVAIEMTALELSSASEDELRFMLATSREALEAAPEFISIWEQDAVMGAKVATQRMQENASTTAPLPAEPMNPTDAVGAGPTESEAAQ